MSIGEMMVARDEECGSSSTPRSQASLVSEMDIQELCAFLEGKHKFESREVAFQAVKLIANALLATSMLDGYEGNNDALEFFAVSVNAAIKKKKKIIEDGNQE